MGEPHDNHAPVKQYHYDNHDQLRTYLADFIDACNFACRLKTFGGRTPCEYICKIRTSVSGQFIINPPHQMPEIND